jgi:hypothetical protein
MMRELTHDQAFSALDAVALDTLENGARDAVLAHADQCAICQRELSQLRDTAAFAAYAAPPVASAETRDRIRSRLMARATAPAPRTEIARDRRAARTNMVSMLAWRRAEWVAVAAGVMLVASVSYLASVMRDRENVQGALEAQTTVAQRARATMDSMRVALMSRDSLIAGLTGPDVAMMTLTSNGVKAPFAHMFWDKAHNTWTLVAHNLPELRSGRTYQLWLVTARAKISAGTFDARNGDAMMRATYALPPDQLRAIAVTEEPAGGMPQPTSAPVMAASH